MFGDNKKHIHACILQHDWHWMC